MSYVQGTVIRVTAAFKTVATDVPVEPSEVVLRVDRPGEEAIEELSLSGGGVFNDPDVAGGYYADLETEDGPSGVWHYQFETTGPTRVTARKDLHIRARV